MITYRLLATKVILGKKASLALPGVKNLGMTFDNIALVNSKNSMAAPNMLVLNLSHLALTKVTCLNATRGSCYPITHGVK